MKVPSVIYYQLHDFKFDDIHMDDDETLRVSQIYSYKKSTVNEKFGVNFFACVSFRRAYECFWSWILWNVFISIMRCYVVGY